MKIDDVARAVLDSLDEGITIIDREGVIVFVNKAYRAFLRNELITGEIEGRRLRDIRPAARLPDVLRDGKPILHKTRRDISDFYFVNMYPIYDDGELIGAVSVVTFIGAVHHVREELVALDARNRMARRAVNKANGARCTFDLITASAPASVASRDLAQRIAATDVTVLLESEVGTGKELYAQAIHNASPRRRRTFVKINCADHRPEVLDSELFGYAGGAFEGAKPDGKMGVFEAAEGGTVFLDEINEMDTVVQAKLLYALQERKIRPLGAIDERSVDVRVIAASNVSLKQLVDEGRFRADLYERLSTFPIHIPPLRERKEDIPLLCREILGDLSRKLHKNFYLTPDAESMLMAHDWPGNVRELRSVLEFSSCIATDGAMTADTLPDGLTPEASRPRQGATLVDRVRAFERAEINKALERCGRSLDGKRQAARELGISLATLYNKLAE